MTQAARISRDMVAASPNGFGAGREWSGEAFTFDSQDQLELIKKLHPELNDPDQARRREAWIKWGQTTVGQTFRAR